MNLDNITAGPVKAAMKDAGASSSDLWNVPIAAIKVMEGFNVRVRNSDYAIHICEIGESILSNGYMKDKPLSGFVANEGGQNIIYVTDGHSRLEAVAYANERGAQITTVPVVTKPAGTSIEDLTVGLGTSATGRPLMPIEKAQVVKRLVGYGMEEAVIAKRLGITVGYVGDLLKLIAAPKKIRAMVESGQVSASNATDAIKKHGSNASDVLTEKLDAAMAAGKTKITKTTIKAPKRDLLADGVKWIRGGEDRYSETDQALIELLSYLTGTNAKDIAKLVEA